MKRIVQGIVLIVLLKLPITETHAIEENNEIRTDITPIQSHTEYVANDALTKLQKQQQEISEHIKGNANPHDGLTIVVNFNGPGQATKSTPRNSGKHFNDIQIAEKPIDFRSDIEAVKSTAITKTATVPTEKQIISNPAKYLDVDSNIGTTLKGYKKIFSSDSSHSSSAGDLESPKSDDAMIVFDLLDFELGKNSTGRPKKQRQIESTTETITTQTTQMVAAKETSITDEQILKYTTNTPSSATQIPLSLYSIEPPQLQSSDSLVELPLSQLTVKHLPSSTLSNASSVPTTLPPIVSSAISPVIQPSVPPVALPSVSPVISLLVTTVVPTLKGTLDVDTNVSSEAKEDSKLSQFLSNSSDPSKIAVTSDDKFSTSIVPSFGSLNTHHETFEKTEKNDATIIPSDILKALEKNVEVSQITKSEKPNALVSSPSNPLDAHETLQKSIEYGVKYSSGTTKDDELLSSIPTLSNSSDLSRATENTSETVAKITASGRHNQFYSMPSSSSETLLLSPTNRSYPPKILDQTVKVGTTMLSGIESGDEIPSLKSFLYIPLIVSIPLENIDEAEAKIIPPTTKGEVLSPSVSPSPDLSNILSSLSDPSKAFIKTIDITKQLLSENIEGNISTPFRYPLDPLNLFKQPMEDGAILLSDATTDDPITSLVPTFPDIFGPLNAFNQSKQGRAKNFTSSTKDSEASSFSDPLGISKALEKALQVGVGDNIISKTRDSELPFLIPSLPNATNNASKTIEKTIELGAKILSGTEQNSELFQSLPKPVESSRTREKGVEVGAQIIAEATKPQNKLLDRSDPNTLSQFDELKKAMLPGTIMLFPPLSIEIHMRNEPGTKNKEKLTDSSNGITLFSKKSDNKETLNIAPSKNSDHIKMDDKSPTHNQIEYENPINNNKIKKDKEVSSNNEVPIDTTEGKKNKVDEDDLIDRNRDSYDKTKHEVDTVRGEHTRNKSEEISIPAGIKTFSPESLDHLNIGKEVSKISSNHLSVSPSEIPATGILPVSSVSDRRIDGTARALEIDPSTMLPVTQTPIPIPHLPLNPLKADVAMSKSAKPFDTDVKARLSQVPLNALEAGLAIIDSPKALVTGAESVSSSNVPPNRIPPPIMVPHVPLNPLEPGGAIAVSVKFLETGAKTLSSKNQIIPSSGILPPVGIPPLPLNPLEAGISIAGALKTGADVLKSQVPNVPPIGMPSPTWIPHALLNPLETDGAISESAKLLETGAKALSFQNQIIPSSGIPPPVGIPPLPLNPLEAGISIAGALKTGADVLKSQVSNVPPIGMPSPTWIPHALLNPLETDGAISESAKLLETGAKALSSKNQIIPSSGIPPPVGIPPLPLNPLEAGISIAGALKTGADVLKSQVPNVPPIGMPSPTWIPHALLNPLETDGAISESAKLLETGAKTLSSKNQIIPSSGIPPPVGIPPLPLNPLEAGISIAGALKTGADVLKSQVPNVPPIRMPSPTWIPHALLNPLETDGAISESAKLLETGAKALSFQNQIIPSSGIPPPVGIPPLPLNPLEAGISIAGALKTGADVLKSQVSNVPPIGMPSPTWIPHALLNPLETDGAISESAKLFETGAKALSFQNPIIPATGTPLPIAVPTLNLLKPGVAIAGPAKALKTDADVLTSQVPNVSPSGIPTPTWVPPVLPNALETNGAIAESAKLLGTGVKVLSSQNSILPVSPEPSLFRISPVPLNPLEAGVVIAESAKAIGIGTEALSPEVPIKPPDGKPTLIDIPPLPLNTHEAGVAITKSAKALATGPDARSSQAPNVPLGGTESNAAKVGADFQDQRVQSLPSSVAQNSSIINPSSTHNPSEFDLKMSVVPNPTATKDTILGSKNTSSASLESDGTDNQNHIETSAELPIHLSLTKNVDSPIIPPSSSKVAEAVNSTEGNSQAAVSKTSKQNSTGESGTEVTLRTSSEKPAPPVLSSALTPSKASPANMTITVSPVTAPEISSETHSIKSEESATESEAGEPTSKSSIPSSIPPLVHPKSQSTSNSISVSGVTTPMPLGVSSTQAEGAALKQHFSDLGIKISEMSEVIETGPKLARSTFSEDSKISEGQPSEEAIEMESFDLASDWNRDMLGKNPIVSASSSIVKPNFDRKHRGSLYKIHDAVRDK